MILEGMEVIMEKVKQTIISNKSWIIFLVCIVVFYEIVENIFQNEIYIFDELVYFYVSKIINDPLTIFMKIITALGSGIVIVTLCEYALLVPKNKKCGKLLVLNTIVIFVINQLLKLIFARPRPEGFRLIEQGGFSFPSGHSMVSMAFYGLIIYFIYKNVNNKYLKWTLISILACLIILIGLSRIYLGVHYASDVIGGFCFSIAYLVVFTKLINMDGNK